MPVYEMRLKGDWAGWRTPKTMPVRTQINIVETSWERCLQIQAKNGN